MTNYYNENDPQTVAILKQLIADGVWRDADWLGCRDGKWRPVEPSTFPLDHGLPGRVGRLRGYGNAIVPQAAAEFGKAFVFAKNMRNLL